MVELFFFPKVIFFIALCIWTWTYPMAVLIKHREEYVMSVIYQFLDLDRAIRVLFYGGIKPCRFPKPAFFKPCVFSKPCSFSHRQYHVEIAFLGTGILIIKRKRPWAVLFL